jgi:hypothetical protein
VVESSGRGEDEVIKTRRSEDGRGSSDSRRCTFGGGVVRKVKRWCGGKAVVGVEVW